MYQHQIMNDDGTIVPIVTEVVTMPESRVATSIEEASPEFAAAIVVPLKKTATSRDHKIAAAIAGTLLTLVLVIALLMMLPIAFSGEPDIIYVEPACRVDSDCASNFICAGGECEKPAPKLPLGSSCGYDDACESAKCDEGKCVVEQPSCEADNDCESRKCLLFSKRCAKKAESGSSCLVHANCASDVCARNTCSDGSFESACSMNGHCETGFCYDGMCETNFPGSRCEIDADCQSTRCQDNKCMDYLANGEPCNSDISCESFFCDLKTFGLCSERRAPGETCTRSEGCASSRCDLENGVCGEFLKEGDMCEKNVRFVNDQCIGELVCGQNRMRCMPQIESGEMCRSSTECVTGYCNAVGKRAFCGEKLELGSTCRSDQDCVSSNCDVDSEGNQTCQEYL